MGPHHPLWNEPLPALGRAATPAPVSHADYFRALRSYVTGPGQRHLQRALAARLPAQTAPRHLQRVTIRLEKHGEFYHPARLALETSGTTVSLVLNVAVTPAGRSWMASELAALPRVAARLPAGCLPTVYGEATLPGPEQTPLAMFLADWFDGFHEFHLSVEPRRGRQGLIVWDTAAGLYHLSDEQQAAVYRQSAYLLARAYDPTTTEQIYPWHHASGDFILRAGEAIVLRLVTVRQFAPTLGGEPERLDEAARLTALLAFFLNMTLRNRLDRLDGTGPIAWAEPLAVPATVEGACRGLDAPTAEALKGLVTALPLSELIDILAALGERYHLMPMELDAIRANLAPHAELLLETFRRMRRRD